MTQMSPEDHFRQSRIYAQGWNAARAWSLGHGPAAAKPATNPYTSEPDKSRWDEGYAERIKKLDEPQAGGQQLKWRRTE